MTTTTVEEPTREELVRIFAKRHPNLSLEAVGELFDEYLALGHLDFRRDELTKRMACALERPEQAAIKTARRRIVDSDARPPTEAVSASIVTL